MPISKQEVLDNIEEASQNKEEKKTVGIAIKSIFGSFLFQSTKTTLVEAIREANLSDANLRDANLRDADLSGANLMRAKFYGRGGTKELKKSQLPDFLGALGFKIVE